MNNHRKLHIKEFRRKGGNITNPKHVYADVVQTLFLMFPVFRVLLVAAQKSLTSVRPVLYPRDKIYVKNDRCRSEINMDSTKNKLIIDTDTGIDDAQAIMMMLHSEKYDVIGITCVRGNSGVTNIGRNVLQTLKVIGRLDIPVYLGSTLSILGRKPVTNDYQGENGFGDCKHLEEPDTSVLMKETATEAMIRLSNEYPGEITLMCIGPLTNLAATLKCDPDFGKRLRECFIMGGNYYGKGNITVSAEFNFHADPEAAFIALEQLQCPTMVVGWEVCEDNGLGWDQYEELRSFPGKQNSFLKMIEERPVAYCHEQGWENYYPADEFLAAVMLNPQDVVMETKKVYVTVELAGNFTRGQMVVDWNKFLKKDPNVTIVTKISKVAFFNELLKLAKKGRT